MFCFRLENCYHSPDRVLLILLSHSLLAAASFPGDAFDHILFYCDVVALFANIAFAYRFSSLPLKAVSP